MAMAETFVGLTTVLALLVLALLVVWILLPLAIVGIKPLLREIRDELRLANELRAAAVRNPVRGRDGPA